MAFDLVKKVNICEVGLRDGLQNEKIPGQTVQVTKKDGTVVTVPAPLVLSVDQKVQLLRNMIDAGFKVIEVGSFMSPKAVPQMANTDEVFKAIQAYDVPEDVQLRALIPNKRGVDRAIACGCKKVKLNVSASEGHNMANLNRTVAESMAGFKECAEYARANGLEISGSISCAFGSPWEGVVPMSDVKKCIEAYMDAGITEISLSDAAGMAMPKQVYEICTEVRREYPENSWWLHFHNTRGMAISNIIAGMQAGMTNFDAAFAGAGGCNFIPNATGNVSTEDVLHAMEGMGVETGIDLVKAIANGKLAQQMMGHTADSYVLAAGRNCDAMEIMKARKKK